MAKLVYAAITSLDGYTADQDGQFDWARPDEDVFAFVTDLERGFGTYLYGRKMYETMVYWETVEESGAEPSFVGDFTALWRAADKVVYSRTLETVSSDRTRIERSFEPAEVLRMKETSGHDMSVAGGNLAAQAMSAGLLDELHLFVVPEIVGGGTPALPARRPPRLELLGIDRFAGGIVHLHYRTGA
ncbi:MAG TPA: dihydrofolate reductase family protein [Acidimicrobiales bacterium]|jgi:dihydrofolate reductase|nr:dihydrofolate reductase family protein [Acidimicrobiales bacterium]